MKKLAITGLCFILTTSISAPVFANTGETQAVVSNVIENASDNSTKRAQDWEYKRESGSSLIKADQYIGVAPGQGADWTVFYDEPAGFNWTPSGSPVTVTVSAPMGVFSISANLGSCGSSGKFYGAKKNKPCRLEVYKDIEIKEYQVYRRPIGTTKWVFYKTEYETSISTDRTRVVYR